MSHLNENENDTKYEFFESCAVTGCQNCGSTERLYEVWCDDDVQRELCAPCADEQRAIEARAELAAREIEEAA